MKKQLDETIADEIGYEGDPLSVHESRTKPAAHTPGPWKIMADPNHAGKHPFHDCRWIATADAEVESSEFVPMDWGLEKGSLICQMRDGVTQSANARLIAAAPELLGELRALTFEVSHLIHGVGDNQQATANALRNAIAAIAKAQGGAM